MDSLEILAKIEEYINKNKWKVYNEYDSEESNNIDAEDLILFIRKLLC